MPEDEFKKLARSVFEDTRDIIGTPGNPHEYMLFDTMFRCIYKSRELLNVD